MRRLRIAPGPPVITIFVRHAPDCKYNGDEFCKRCGCRKHLRWSSAGKQYRRSAGTRSWAEAEEKKRKLEDQLAGRAPAEPESKALTMDEALTIFDASKQAQGVVAPVRSQYARDLADLKQFSEARHLFTVAQVLTFENLIAWRGTWPSRIPSTYTQKVTQARVRHFVRFAADAGWIAKAPRLSSIKVESEDTQPLTDAEYNKLLEHAEGKVRTLIQLMRWSGLAIRDAALLKRTDLVNDGKSYRIIRERTKTGTPLFIPIPPGIGGEVLAVANGNPVYVFWDRQTEESSEYVAASNWGKRVSDVFTAAGIVCDGHMVSHRLRDTFAVDLLSKNVPLEHVSKLLGHKSVTTTEKHYAKWVKGRQDLLERVVSATWKK
jgi:integrase